MKKVLLGIIFSVSTLIVSAQLTGDGTSSNPFRGTLSSTETWAIGEFTDNTVFIGNTSTPDLSVITNGHLIIEPGLTLVFTQLNSDLFITGTGQITAGGEGIQVKFTKDPGKAHWGHISFQNMGTNPASSTFTNCLFEYGYTTGTSSQPLLAGGAIQVDFNNVVISYCSFIDNYATFAGAVMINSNRNTKISNCYFESNEAYECGGAMIIYTNSTAEIKNCIFAYNYSKGNATSSYSGGAIWSFSNPSKVLNCTFVENTSDRAGDAIYSYSSSNMRIVNSIFWGSNDQFAGSSNTSTIVTCAFEAAKPANAINSIIISNVASDHFNDATNDDWSLKYISPCRDAGTNSFGSPNVIPATDYLGNNRVLTTDIGAYEVQYSRWKTTASSTDWTTPGNWDGGIPTSTKDVIIPAGASNYPTASPGPDHTIGTGKQMIIEPGARLTLGSLTNNGTLKLNANASALSSLILNSYTRGTNASEELQLRVTGGYIGDPEYNEGKWHYISSPVNNLSIDPIFTTTTYNLAQWVDGIQGAGSIREGWVAYDGYIYYSYPESFSGPTFDHLVNGKGYNLWYSNDTTYTVSGTLNTDDVSMTLNFAGDAYINGYNLLGNPFTSGLDWDYIVENTDYPDNTSQGIIFTKDNEQYYYIAGVMTPDNGETPSGVIPPMQGFFVKTYSKNNVINLTTDARSHDDIWPRFKGTSEIPLLRLIINENGFSDETVVRFAEKAETGLDYSYDALKMFMPDNKPALYTLAGTNKFSINGQPFLQPETFIEIPLSVKVLSNGNHTITLKSKQSLEEYDIYLIDKTTGSETDLKKTPSLSFPAAAGLINNRFLIKISNITIGIEDPKTGDDQFNIYDGFGLINIQTLADEWDGKRGSIRIMDISGKTVSDLRNTEFSKTSVTQVQAPALNGLYMLEIRSGVKRYVRKVVIR